MQDREVRQVIEGRGGYPTKPKGVSPRAVRAEGAEPLATEPSSRTTIRGFSECVRWHQDLAIPFRPAARHGAHLWSDLDHETKAFSCGLGIDLRSMSRTDGAFIMQTGPKTGAHQNEPFAPAIALPQGD